MIHWHLSSLSSQYIDINVFISVHNPFTIARQCNNKVSTVLLFTTLLRVLYYLHFTCSMYSTYMYNSHSTQYTIVCFVVERRLLHSFHLLLSLSLSLSFFLSLCPLAFTVCAASRPLQKLHFECKDIIVALQRRGWLGRRGAAAAVCSTLYSTVWCSDTHFVRVSRSFTASIPFYCTVLYCTVHRLSFSAPLSSPLLLISSPTASQYV